MIKIKNKIQEIINILLIKIQNDKYFSDNQFTIHEWLVKNQIENNQIPFIEMYFDKQQKLYSLSKFKEKLTYLKLELTKQENQFIQVKNDWNQQNRNKKKSQQVIIQNKPLTKNKLSQHSVCTNPEYFRIDHNICERLFQKYSKKCIGLHQASLLISFDERQQHQKTMNYQKILEICKDINIELNFQQKSKLLKLINKNCFNKQFISTQQFKKLYKYMVFYLRCKESQLQKICQKQSISLYKTKLLPNLKKKNIKTEEQEQKSSVGQKNRRRNTEQTQAKQYQNLSRVNKVINVGKIMRHVYESAGSSRKIKINKQTNCYLDKAMICNKVSKLTWQSLFAMNENNMHSNITIPEIVRRQMNQRI